MTRRLLGPVGGSIIFFAVAALVFAALGWVTVAAMRVEQAQRQTAADAELASNLRVALLRLDFRVSLPLSGEDNRPYYHYAGDVAEDAGPIPGPLVSAQFPDWMKLHFQVDPDAGWQSPQVLPSETVERFRSLWPEVPLRNVTDERRALLTTCEVKYPARQMAEALTPRDRPPVPAPGPGSPPAPTPDATTQEALPPREAPVRTVVPPPSPPAPGVEKPVAPPAPPAAETARVLGLQFRVAADDALKRSEVERFSGLRSETEGRGPPVSLSAAQPAPANPPGRGGNPPTFMNSAGRGGNAPAPVTPPADGGSPQMPPAPQTGNTVTAAPPPSPRQAFEADKTTAFGARQGIQGRAMEDARKAAEQPQISRNYRGQLDGVAGNQAVPGNNDLTLKRLKELAGVPGQPKTPGELADIVRRRQAGSADPPGLPGAAGGAPAGGPATMPGLGATAPTGPGGFGGPGGPPAGLGGEPSRSKGAAGGAPPPAPGMGGRSGAAGGFGRAMPGPDRDADGFGKDAAKKLRLEKAEPMGEDRAARGPVTGPGGVPAGANPAGQPSKPGDEREMRRFAEQLKADEAPAYGMLGRFSALARRERGLEEKYKLLTPQSPPMSGGLAEAKPTGAAAKPEVAEKEAKDAKEGPAREAGLKLADAEKGPADEPKPEPTVPAPEPTRPVAPPISVHLGSMRPQWLTGADGSEVLVLVRAARLGETKTVYQGVVLDWPRLQEVLRDEVKDLFPAARLLPVKDPAGVSPERAMTALPVQLDPGPPPGLPPAGWTPLRLGLVLAWVAAVIAFAAVGLSGWSLIDLAERRIRFVSAVTHELRTPLTSLRLYLDLLLSGMVRDEAKRTEYLATLDAESDRLHRLIDNVLDFARLERRRTRAYAQPIRVGELLDQVRVTWADRCGTDGKELVVISTLPAEQQVCTDAQLVGQIVGNLIDNARKYTREAADPRIWLWAKPAGRRWVVFEVEDRGPGVPPGERRAIFRPFRRGDAADTRAGGAGLGLALAKQWAEALGGRLSYRPADGGVGACFRLELRVR